MGNATMRAFLPQRSVLGALERTIRVDPLTPVEQRMLIRQFALSAVGGIVGYLVGRKYMHPVLGLLGGLSAGTSAALVSNGLPAEAAYVALAEASAIGLSLYWSKHPAAGYVGGSLLFGALLGTPGEVAVGAAGGDPRG